MVRRRLPPALRERDFALLWSATLGMRFAEQMLAVAVGWQVYAIRGNPLDLGLIGLAEFLPLPLLALPAEARPYARRLLVARLLDHAVTSTCCRCLGLWL